MEKCIRCELIGGVSKIFKHFYNFLYFYSTLHTYQYMLFIVANVDSTHIDHVAHYKIISACHIL